jgi:hypothetical protein
MSQQPEPTPTPTPVPDPTPPPPPPDPSSAEVQKLQELNAKQARELALAQARLDFPKADADVLGKFQGTVDDLRGFAKTLHEREAARQPTSPPAPVPGPGNSTTAEDQANAEYATLRNKVIVQRSAEPWEVQRFGDLAFGRLINQHAADRKSGRSSTEGVAR